MKALLEEGHPGTGLLGAGERGQRGEVRRGVGSEHGVCRGEAVVGERRRVCRGGRGGEEWGTRVVIPPGALRLLHRQEHVADEVALRGEVEAQGQLLVCELLFPHQRGAVLDFVIDLGIDLCHQEQIIRRAIRRYR